MDKENITIQTVGLRSNVTETVPVESFEEYFIQIGDNLYEMIITPELQVESDRVNKQLDWITYKMPHILIAINNPKGNTKGMTNMFMLGNIVSQYLKNFPDSNHEEFIKCVNVLRHKLESAFVEN